VLIVEDHVSLRDVQRLLLQSEGLQVRVAGSADEALLMLQRGTAVDVLLCDVRTPGCLDGLELCRWARRSHPTMAILVQTASMDLDTGDFQVLRKPFTPAQLVARLRVQLDDLRRRRWDRVRAAR
jgi:CheY-like chemotaxis protein